MRKKERKKESLQVKRKKKISGSYNERKYLNLDEENYGAMKARKKIESSTGEMMSEEFRSLRRKHKKQ